METVYASEGEKVLRMPEARPGQVLGVVPVFHGRKLAAMRSYDPEHPGIYIDIIDRNGTFQQLAYIEDVSEDDELEYAGNIHALLNTRIGLDDYDREALIPHENIDKEEEAFRAELEDKG